METGLNPGGYLVCKFTFKVRGGGSLNRLVCLCVAIQRLPNQPLIPTRVLDSDSNTSGGDDGSGDEDEDEDRDVTSDEE